MLQCTKCFSVLFRNVYMYIYLQLCLMFFQEKLYVANSVCFVKCYILECVHTYKHYKQAYTDSHIPVVGCTLCWRISKWSSRRKKLRNTAVNYISESLEVYVFKVLEGLVSLFVLTNGLLFYSNGLLGFITFPLPVLSTYWEHLSYSELLGFVYLS